MDEHRFVPWKEWASTQVAVAMLEVKVKGLCRDMQRLRDRMDTHLSTPSSRLDWKWWVQMMMLTGVIAFLVLANTNEKLASEILATMRVIFGR